MLSKEEVKGFFKNVCLIYGFLFAVFVVPFFAVNLYDKVVSGKVFNFPMSFDLMFLFLLNFNAAFWSFFQQGFDAYLSFIPQDVAFAVFSTITFPLLGLVGYGLLQALVDKTKWSKPLFLVAMVGVFLFFARFHNYNPFAGARIMLPFLPLMAIPFAYSFKRLKEKPPNKLFFVFFGFVALYLLVGLPVWAENNDLVQQCYGVCSEKDSSYNLVFGAASIGKDKPLCYCVASTQGRVVEVVEISEPVEQKVYDVSVVKPLEELCNEGEFKEWIEQYPYDDDMVMIKQMVTYCQSLFYVNRCRIDDEKSYAQFKGSTVFYKCSNICSNLLFAAKFEHVDGNRVVSIHNIRKEVREKQCPEEYK